MAEHLPRDIARLAADYLCVTDQWSDRAMLGVGEEYTIGGADTNLLYACRFGHIELAEWTIACGACDFKHAFYQAADHGHVELARMMLDRGRINVAAMPARYHADYA